MSAYDVIRSRLPVGWRLSATIATEDLGDLVEVTQKRTGEPLDVRTVWIGADGVVWWGARIDGRGEIVTAEGVRFFGGQNQ